MLLEIISNILLIGIVYFSIGLSHWLFFKRFKRLDFSIAALILLFAYVCSFGFNWVSVISVLIFLPLLVFVLAKINPWKGTKGFIASLMIFSIIINLVQVIFGTVPKIGQISDFNFLFTLSLIIFLILVILWKRFGFIIIACSEDKKRLVLVKEAWFEKYVFLFIVSISILFSSLEYLWVFNISIENGFRIALIGALVALSSKSFRGLVLFSFIFSIFESASVFFLPSGFKDIIPLFFLILLILFRGEKNGLF
jgi:hypothetical protein